MVAYAEVHLDIVFDDTSPALSSAWSEPVWDSCKLPNGESQTCHNKMPTFVDNTIQFCGVIRSLTQPSSGACGRLPEPIDNTLRRKGLL